MNVFQHFGGKIPTYQEFVNSKRMAHALDLLVRARNGYGERTISYMYSLNKEVYYAAMHFSLVHFYVARRSSRYYKQLQKHHRELFMAMAGIS